MRMVTLAFLYLMAADGIRVSMVEFFGGLDRGGERVLGGHGVLQRRVNVVEVGG